MLTSGIGPETSALPTDKARFSNTSCLFVALHKSPKINVYLISILYNSFCLFVLFSIFVKQMLNNGGSYPRPYYQGPSARTMGKYLAHEVETSRIINDHFLFGNGILFDIAPPMSGESLNLWERWG